MEVKQELEAVSDPVIDTTQSPDTETQTVNEPDNTTQEQIKSIVEKYTPGIDLTSQESVDNAVLSLLKALDRVQTKLTVAVENDPELGAALSEIMNGGKARVALARSYGPEAFQPVEGDPDYDEMTKGYNEASERIRKKEELSSTIRNNQEMSLQEIKAWMDEKGYGDEEIMVRLEKLEELRQDFLNDKITKKHMGLIDKALDFDKAVQEAEEAGKIAGRNERIVEKREKLKPSKEGLPQLTQSGTSQQRPQRRSLLEQLREEE